MQDLGDGDGIALARAAVLRMPKNQGMIVVDVAGVVEVALEILRARRVQMAPVIQKNSDRLWLYAMHEGGRATARAAREAGFDNVIAYDMTPLRALEHWEGPIDLVVARSDQEREIEGWCARAVAGWESRRAVELPIEQPEPSLLTLDARP